mgnify:CR=1 FL=1
MEELVKMSPKGQLVVPKDIRDKEKFKPSDRFIAVGVKNGILFKKINMPKVKIEFEALSKEISKQFKRDNIKKSDVDEAVKWIRKG